MRRRVAAVAATLFLAGCGYVGDPLPPALHMPVAIQDLRGVQRGASILIAFTPSLKSTEDLVLPKLSAIELRAGENMQGAFDLYQWLVKAKTIHVAGAKAEAMQVSVPASEWAGKEVVFVVRALGPTGRGGPWSNLLVLRVVAAPAAPTGVTVRGTAQGLYLQWKGEGAAWRVLRQAEGESEMALLGAAAEASWLDPNVEYGKTYTYAVQQVVEAGAVPAESEISALVSLKHEDRFAPKAPAGLAAIAGLSSVELNWDRNSEPDWASYQVWRAEGGEAPQRLGAVVKESSFSDGTAVKGRKYRYAVSAIDQAGNESAPSAAVEVTLP